MNKNKSTDKHVLMLLENAPYVNDARVPNEAKTLTSIGYKVSVICPKSPQGVWREQVEGVQIYSYPPSPAGNSFIGYIFEYGYSMVATFLISVLIFIYEDFDVIHAHCPPDTFVFLAAFYKLLGKRFVFDHHDLAPEMYFYGRFKKNGRRLIYDFLVVLEKLSCRLADLVIATNESYKLIEMERGNVPEDKISVVRNGPDLERIYPMEPDPTLRNKASTILGYVGGMGPQDGVDYFLRALNHLVYNLERRDVFSVIIGKGDVLPDLKILVKELLLEDFVWLTGWIADEEMIRYLSTSDICVDPDPSNPFNDRCTMIKMMEYMALGKPIVAFDLLEHRVTAQDAAVYARSNDECDFAQQIATLIDDPDKREKMGQFGMQRIRDELAWSHQKNHLLEAYLKLTNGRIARA